MLIFGCIALYIIVVSTILIFFKGVSYLNEDDE